MSYLLIIFVIFVALAPLLSMMPSRRQRALADLRQAAASSGLYVKLEREGPGEERVYYGCRRQRGDNKAAPALLVQTPDGWQQERGNWPAERLQALSALPAGVGLLREDGEGIALTWDEQGTREDVDAIARALRQLLGRHW